MTLAALSQTTHDDASVSEVTEAELDQIVGGFSLYPESDSGPHTQGAPNETGSLSLYPTSGA